jgi:Rieske 2Fe-2S family protein
VFVCLASDPEPLAHWLARTTPWALGFERLPVAGYRIGARTETIVHANWKIILENYSECLHCAVVHPELAELIPLYRTGNVVHPDDPTAPVEFADGRVAFTRTGQSTLSVLPGVDPRGEYDGVCVFPNVFFDLTPTVLALTATFPLAADRSLVVGEYLFAAADLDRPDFDPTPEVEFNELVGAQDYVVCEMVQRGVASKAFTTGGLTRKDAYVIDFIEGYLAVRGPLGTDQQGE